MEVADGFISNRYVGEQQLKINGFEKMSIFSPKTGKERLLHLVILLPIFAVLGAIVYSSVVVFIEKLPFHSIVGLSKNTVPIALGLYFVLASRPIYFAYKDRNND